MNGKVCYININFIWCMKSVVFVKETCFWNIYSYLCISWTIHRSKKCSGYSSGMSPQDDSFLSQFRWHCATENDTAKYNVSKIKNVILQKENTYLILFKIAWGYKYKRNVQNSASYAEKYQLHAFYPLICEKITQCILKCGYIDKLTAFKIDLLYRKCMINNDSIWIMYIWKLFPTVLHSK